MRQATPRLFAVSGAEWLANEALGEEVFGPLGLIIRAKNMGQMLEIAQTPSGHSTCTLHMDESGASTAQRLMPILEHKPGRILANSFPSGVEIRDAMVHGGPYPAFTNFGATSVGTLSIRRWLRPVCFQNIPENLLAVDLQ